MMASRMAIIPSTLKHMVAVINWVIVTPKKISKHTNVINETNDSATSTVRDVLKNLVILLFFRYLLEPPEGIEPSPADYETAALPLC